MIFGWSSWGRNNYPPDREKAAIDLVIKQMEDFANEWSTNGTWGT